MCLELQPSIAIISWIDGVSNLVNIFTRLTLGLALLEECSYQSYWAYS